MYSWCPPLTWSHSTFSGSRTNKPVCEPEPVKSGPICVTHAEPVLTLSRHPTSSQRAHQVPKTSPLTNLRTHQPTNQPTSQPANQPTLGKLLHTLLRNTQPQRMMTTLNPKALSHPTSARSSGCYHRRCKSCSRVGIFSVQRTNTHLVVLRFAPALASALLHDSAFTCCYHRTVVNKYLHATIGFVPVPTNQDHAVGHAHVGMRHV